MKLLKQYFTVYFVAGDMSFLLNKYLKIVKGKIKGNLIYAYYGKHVNFGDQLTPLILDYYGFTTVYAHYKPKYRFAGKAEIISVGTFLQNTPSDFDGIIIGTGNDDIQKTFQLADILSVRGKITQHNLGLENREIALGDPGLLVSYLYPQIKQKKYKLGIIPHFFDKVDCKFNKYLNRFQQDVQIIDVQRHPEEVIDDIKQCENIISSSLHGLVVADSFNIPNIMFINNFTMPERGVKYKDYYSAFGICESYIELTGN